MSFPGRTHVNDPGSSPVDAFSELSTLKPFLPFALALIADDGLGVKQALRQWATEDPMDALVAVVLGGGLAFYVAEHETNAACRSPWDGILFAATSLSVGYDNLFPTTSAGHAIASFVQTFGPALASSAFDPPAAERRAAIAEAAAVDRAILARLDDIVRLLEAQAAR